MITVPEDYNEYPYNIADAEGDDSGLEQFISKYEPEILKEVLGRPLYEELDAETEPFATLINGAEYVDEDNHKQYYDGLKPAIVPYVYSKWLEKDVQQAGDGSLQAIVPENTSNVSPATKISEAWNDSESKFAQMFLYLQQHLQLFDEFAQSVGYEDMEEYMDMVMCNIGTKNEFDL